VGEDLTPLGESAARHGQGFATVGEDFATLREDLTPLGESAAKHGQGFATVGEDFVTVEDFATVGRLALVPTPCGVLSFRPDVFLGGSFLLLSESSPAPGLVHVDARIRLTRRATAATIVAVIPTS
jgi:hypothetical protein